MQRFLEPVLKAWTCRRGAVAGASIEECHLGMPPQPGSMLDATNLTHPSGGVRR